MRLRVVTVVLACLGLMAYFAYHTITGNHGLRARAPIERQVVTLEGELAGLRAVRAQLERDVALLRSDRLDPDMLDERARALLNLAHPNDLVIMTPEAAKGLPR